MEAGEEEEDGEDEWEEVSESELAGEGGEDVEGGEGDDEALARRLQEQEDLETRARLMALAGMGPAGTIRDGYKWKGGSKSA